MRLLRLPPFLDRAVLVPTGGEDALNGYFNSGHGIFCVTKTKCPEKFTVPSNPDEKVVSEESGVLLMMV
jgi:hypothetical protein